MEKKVSEMTFFEKVSHIQTKLKAPKGQYNSFGKYSYRSCEDILEGVKPLLAETGLVLTIDDEIQLVGDRYYIKATATIGDGENTISNSAFAREPVSRKGMDDAQVTGSTSSYARKYSLNGLLCIDDTKDADTDEHKKLGDKDNKPQQQQTDYKAKYAAIAQIKDLAGKACRNKTTQEKGEYMHRYMGVNKFDELNKFSLEELNKIIALIK